MSKLPITHCEHGIDRAYRCIDCIEAERDALRAWAQELDRQLHEANFTASVLRLSRGHARRELASLRASIVALAEDWEETAQELREQANPDCASGFVCCATELRRLGESDIAAAQEEL